MIKLITKSVLWSLGIAFTIAGCAIAPEDDQVAESGEGVPLEDSPKYSPTDEEIGTIIHVDFCTDRPDSRYPIRLTSGNWGSWNHCASMCPRGSFAYRVNLLSEGSLGSGGDDTALNGVSLHCFNRTTGAFTGYVTSRKGSWGTWQDTAICPGENTDRPIASGNIKLEAPQGSADDTSANDLIVQCIGNTTETAVDAQTGWGTWQGKKSCPSGQAVCGISTRTESAQGSGDDTALNGVVFECCQLCPSGKEANTSGVCVNAP